MRQQIRRTIIYLSLLLFPLTLNYFSPYVSVDGAFNGIVAGSVLLFLAMFVSGIVCGRAWCAWICPMAGLSELSMTINPKPASVRKLTIIRYSVFAVWFSALVGGFVLAGGIRSVNPLHLTEAIISVDEPIKYVIYYGVLLLFFGLTLRFGKRGACHSICWMSPFLVGGYLVGRQLRLPQLRIQSQSANCTACGACDRKCQMGIAVSSQVESGEVRSLDCILCGECVDGCPKRALRYGWHK